MAFSIVGADLLAAAGNLKLIADLNRPVDPATMQMGDLTVKLASGV